MGTTELYVLGLSLALIGVMGVLGAFALAIEWLMPGWATHPTFARFLLGRIESTRRNRVLMSLSFIVTAVFFGLAVNLLLVPAVVAFLAWLPLGIWLVRTAFVTRAKRSP
ncbi:hypothetical protein [Arenimonas sp.]|uniref:hypothetical protein n=1 Tax=Arenimonas sp. TaxID=1872635 RepID=UPI002E33BB51|nr:hypothetical protein [Arenimonas sp.]HEX4854024.1 hypothetical protein [Arenimonas sp.]